MAKKKEAEPKVVLEREYIVPLRKGWLKVPKYKRASKAVKTLKQFIAKHMKVYDRDTRKIKIEQILNNEIRFRGMKKPLAKIKVRAVKYDNDIVRVELVNIPEKIKFARLREAKQAAKLAEKAKAKPEKAKPEEEKKEDEIEGKKEEEAKEKEMAAKEENLARAKEQAKESKHISKEKKVQIHRKALSR